MIEEPNIVGQCRAPGCGIDLISKKAWQAGARPDGCAKHGSRGLCDMHYKRLTRNGTFERGTPVSTGRVSYQKTRSLNEVLEDYVMIRDSVSSVRQAAERMGMTFSALDRALYRARQKGLSGALPPNDQIDRAIRFGSAHYLAA